MVGWLAALPHAGGAGSAGQRARRRGDPGSSSVDPGDHPV